MANEVAIDKVHTGTTIKIETMEKVMAKFGKPGESFAVVLGRVCEELTKDVKLPKSTIERIDAKIKDNYERRMQRRALKER